jgi:K+-sensing histidine kinase KdpD
MALDQTNSRFDEDNLVFMMGEELKKPLTAIQALAESNSESQTIRLEARRALRTIDNVLLYQQLAADQLSMQFSPVHIGSTLTNVARDLQPLSIERGCETEVFIQSGIATVDSDPRVLKSGIESLWQAVLGMTERPSPLVWKVYRAPQGIRIAVINNSVDLSKVHLSKINKTKSKQPFAGIAGPGTDLVAARGIFDLLGSNISKIHKEGQHGLAVTLPISKQLALM